MGAAARHRCARAPRHSGPVDSGRRHPVRRWSDSDFNRLRRARGDVGGARHRRAPCVLPDAGPSGSRRRLAAQWRRMARRQVRWPGPARDPSPSDPDRPAGRRGDRHRNAGRLPAVREPAAQPAREMGCDLVFADCRVRLHLRRQSVAPAEHRVLSRVSARDSSGLPVHGRPGVLRGVVRGAGGVRARHPPVRAAGQTPPRREVGCGQRVAAGELSVCGVFQRALLGGPVPARDMRRVPGDARAAIRISRLLGPGRWTHPAEWLAAGDPDLPAGLLPAAVAGQRSASGSAGCCLSRRPLPACCSSWRSCTSSSETGSSG